jgi:hypothetical protein
MAYFLCKLLPPRPSFPFDMTAEEAELMQRHASYWREQMAQGLAIAFGPVFDPKGAWGLALAAVADGAALAALTGGDPLIRAERGFQFETYPMPSLVHQGQTDPSADLGEHEVRQGRS